MEKQKETKEKIVELDKKASTANAEKAIADKNKNTEKKENKAVAKIDRFKGFLDKQKGEFNKVLPSHISFEKFQRTVTTAVLTQPELLDADLGSLMVSCMKSATDGLLPDGRDAALVTFNTKQGDGWIKKVQYLPMYSGILKKVRQSGDLASVVTHVVYERDMSEGIFDYMLGDEERITHKPYIGIEDRGEIIAAYCIAKLKDGTVFREVMTRQEIDKVRRSSKAGAMSENDVKYSKDKEAQVGDPKGIWKEWYEEMARKTVFRRCAKWLPQAIELVENAFSNDDSMAVMEEKGVTTIDSSEFETIDNETGEIIEEPKNVEEQLESFKEKNKSTVTKVEKEEVNPETKPEVVEEEIETVVGEPVNNPDDIFPADLPFKR